MTASTKPKTPSMTLAIQPNAIATEINAFCKLANRLTLSQVVDTVVVHERLAQQTHRRQFTVQFTFYPKEEYEAEYSITPADILTAFGMKFSSLLRREIQLELKKLDADMKSHLAQLGKGKKVRRSQDESGNDETPINPDDQDGSEVGDGDTFASKRAQQAQQQTSYESDEDEIGPVNEFNDDEIEDAYNSPDESDADSEAGAGLDSAPANKRDLTDRVAAAQTTFMANLKEASAFKFSESGASFELDVSRWGPFGVG